MSAARDQASSGKTAIDYFRYDDDTWLYGVFDGHDQNTVAEYASQKMSAELLLGQLQSNMTDDEVQYQQTVPLRSKLGQIPH